MSYYKEQMRELLTRRAGDSLDHRGYPRATALFVLLLSLLTAYICWTTLFTVGVNDLGLRIPVCVLAAYATYLLSLSVWFLCVLPTDDKSLLVDGSGKIITDVPGKSRFDDLLDNSVEENFQRLGDDVDSVLG